MSKDVLASVSSVRLTLMSMVLDWDGMAESCCRRPCVTLRFCFRLSFSADRHSTRFSESVAPLGHETEGWVPAKQQMCQIQLILSLQQSISWSLATVLLRMWKVTNSWCYYRELAALTVAVLSLDSSSSRSSMQLLSSSICDKIETVKNVVFEDTASLLHG